MLQNYFILDINILLDYLYWTVLNNNITEVSYQTKHS